MIRALLVFCILLAGICGSTAAFEGENLEEFFSRHIAYDLEEPGIFGAVVAVVSDREIISLLGYGFADAEGTYPLDPEDTLLPIGSVTKLFTWEAALRLSDQGMLNADTDINRYLPDPIIPDMYTQPITLKHLMSHTSGLDEVAIGIFTQHPEEIRPAFETYVQSQPARVREPGRIASYSNIGALLAGAAIEEVSGTSYQDYIEGAILTPLGMDSTTAREPLPDHLAARSPETALTEGIPVYSRFPPSGGMHTTAHDMGLYMIHALEPGGDAYPRIFSHDSRLSGATRGGYFERFHGERRILWHAGDVPGTSALLAIIPEENLGIFICYTGAGGSAERFVLLYSFIDTYLGPERGEELTSITGSTRTYEGRYISSRAPVAGFERILLIIGRDRLTVRVHANGERIRIGDSVYQEVEPGYFAGINTHEKLVFAELNGEHWLFMDSIPSIGWKRAGWLDNPELNYLFLLAFGGIFLSGAIIGGKRAYETTNPSEKKKYRLIALVTGTAILYLLLFFGIIHTAGTLFWLPHWFIPVRWIPFVTAVLTVFLILHLVENRQKRESIGIFIGAVAVLFLVWLWYWSQLLPL